MGLPFAGLQILNGVITDPVTALQTATATPTKITAPAWTALVPTTHGGLDAVPSVANSNIVLTEGNWEVNFNASVYQDGTSATKPVGVVETLTLTAYLDGVAIAGATAIGYENELQSTAAMMFSVPFNVAHGADRVLEIRISTSEPGGFDYILLNANFIVKRLD